MFGAVTGALAGDGVLAGTAAGVSELVRDRLGRAGSTAENQALARCESEPTPDHQAALRVALTEAVSADEEFAHRLEEKLQPILTVSHQGDERTVGGKHSFTNVKVGDMRRSHFSVGPMTINNTKKARFSLGAIALAVLLLSGYGGYALLGKGEPSAADADDTTPVQGAKGSSSTGALAMPVAATVDDAAAQVRRLLGSCDRFIRFDDRPIDSIDKSQGLRGTGVCTTDVGPVEITMLDVSRHEAFNKTNDLGGGSRFYGRGYLLELNESAPGTDERKKFNDTLLRAGYLYLNCNKDYKPYEGVKVVRAKTQGCLYSDSV
ncbi:hypothetical protein [Streptomyces sp. NPDC050145]|uniref:hypothetical protein n=1 Tax=Streptomyces sp. NPDC050145 TaxID=3365602 RepID=UPI00379B84CC